MRYSISNIAESKKRFPWRTLGLLSTTCGKFLPRKILPTNSHMSWGERSRALTSRPRGSFDCNARRLSRHRRGDWSFCSNQKCRTARRPSLRLRLRSRRFGQHWSVWRHRCRHPLLRQPSRRSKFHSRRLQAPASRGRKSTYLYI